MFYILSLMLIFGFCLRGGNEPAPTLLLYLCGITVGVIALVLGAKKPLKVSVVTWSAAVIALWTTIEWFTSPVTYLSRLEGLQILFYCLTALAAQQLETNDQKRLLACVGGIALTNSLLIIGEQLLTQNVQISLLGITPSTVAGRYSGIFQNPNTAGEVAVMGLGVFLFWFTSVQRKPSYSLAGSCIIAVFTAAIVATQSRGATLLTFGLLLLALPVRFLLTKNKQTLQAAVFALICLVTMLSLQSQVLHRLSAIKTTSLSTQSQIMPATGETERIEIWRGSLTLWHKEPLLGIHPGLLNERWFEVQPENIQEMPYKSHSLPITLLCEYGLIGGLIGLGILLIWLYKLKTNWCQLSPIQQAAAIGALVLLAGDMIDYSLYVPLHGLIFCVLVALSTPTSEKQVNQLPVKAIIGTLTLCLLTYGVQQAIWCFGTSTSVSLEDRIAANQNLIRWMPDNAVAHQELSNLYRTQGNNKSAMQEQVLVYKLNPFDLHRTSLAYLIYPTNPQKADEIMQQAIAQATNSFVIYNVAADYYQHTGRTNTANAYKARGEHLHLFWRQSAFKVKP